jgi:hypothetical protein
MTGCRLPSSRMRQEVAVLRPQSSVSLLSALISLGIFSGCNSDAKGPAAGNAQTGPSVGASCHTETAGQTCIGVKYVAYTDTTGTPVASQADALTDLQVMNSIWAQCHIAYQIDTYFAADPSQYSLNFSPSDLTELDNVREAFGDDYKLVMVTTGSLGQSTANAWTAMPGSDNLGSVLESPVASFGNIYAHEIGHQLNLVHVADTTDVMDPTIYQDSTELSQSQCASAQAQVAQYPAMLR